MRNASPSIVIALVGNKLDLDGERQISTEEGQAYADEANLLFTEASARNGNNVSDAFLKIAHKLPKTDQQLASPRLAADGRRLDLGRGGSFADRSQNKCC